MDIREWPLDKLMQLPDWCYGSRWAIITNIRVAGVETLQWLVKDPLPDKIILWELGTFRCTVPAIYSWIKFSLGDHEPKNAADFDTFEPLFWGDLNNEVKSGAIYLNPTETIQISMKRGIETKNKQFAIQTYNAHASSYMVVSAKFIISSIPTEVPDWLFSGQGKGLL